MVSVISIFKYCIIKNCEKPLFLNSIITMNLPKLILHPAKIDALLRRHPYVFSGAIKGKVGVLREGDVVELYLPNGNYLATAHYQAGGSIAARILSFEQQPIDAAFWRQALQKAFQYRLSTGIADNILAASATNAYRLVHGEGDALPGLIIDFYNGTAVMQCHTAGMYQSRQAIAEAMSQVLGERLKAVYDKSAETLPQNTGLTAQNAYLIGGLGKNEILENGCKYYVDWESGQKTGFFLDQRDSRQLLTQYAKYRRVLNTFCYTGGFSVAALRAGAALVCSIDSSQKAIDLCQQNISLNGVNADRHSSHCTDVMKFLQQSTPNAYDLIVLDPPAYAKHIDARHNAIQGYKRLNAKALSLIDSGGLLFTFSCSAVIDSALFAHTIAAAAIEVGRSVRILHRLSQPPDHPVNIFHPEGAYLKGLVLYVE